VAPGTTIDLLSLVNRLILPTSVGESGSLERGREVQERLQSPILRALTTLGSSAAERFNQFAG